MPHQPTLGIVDQRPNSSMMTAGVLADVRAACWFRIGYFRYRPAEVCLTICGRCADGTPWGFGSGRAAHLQRDDARIAHPALALYKTKEDRPMDQLETLIDLLTCGELEADEVRQRAANVRNAADDPDLDWLDEPSEEELMQVALQSQLSDFFAIGDKVDEVHELIADIFEPPFPEYPHPPGTPDFLPDDYFRWLDDVLAKRGPGYELLLWGNQ